MIEVVLIDNIPVAYDTDETPPDGAQSIRTATQPASRSPYQLDILGPYAKEARR